jgi:plastocyanin
MAQRRLLVLVARSLLLAGAAGLCAQEPPANEHRADVTAQLIYEATGRTKKTEQHPPAVLWLNPIASYGVSSLAPGKFTLTQKNKMFSPHLLVVPVGSVVAFPNADPFFHNVFSLFDGRRFDLGLYEAGSSRRVTFSREGVSYIFCNIHAEMSAVVIALSTPLYSQPDALGVFHLRDVPEGDYELHLWIEGQKQNDLDRLTRRVHVAAGSANLGEIRAGHPDASPHLNKFGKPYEPDAHPIY